MDYQQPLLASSDFYTLHETHKHKQIALTFDFLHCLRHLSTMALLGSCLAGEMAFRLLFSPLGSKALARTACLVGGVAIPAYSSFKAIELKNEQQQEHWLFYWTAYGCLTAVEIISDKLLSWLPGYYHAKLAFLMWLQIPSKNGSRKLLSTYLRPSITKHQEMLDLIVDTTRNDINNFLFAYLRELKLIKLVALKLAHHVIASVREMMGSSKFLPQTKSKPKERL